MRSKAILKDYFKALTDVAGQGDAREESFYSCLEALFQQSATSTARSEVHVTTLPKKTEAGGPLPGLGCVFHTIPATHSTPRRPLIPQHSGHPFQTKPATCRK